MAFGNLVSFFVILFTGHCVPLSVPQHAADNPLVPFSEILTSEPQLFHCNNTLLDPKLVTFLNKCGTPSLSENIDDFMPYLCMTFLDVNLRICKATVSEERKVLLPTTAAELDAVLSALDEPTIVEDFCKEVNTSIPQTNFAQTSKYVETIKKHLSTAYGCGQMCYESAEKIKPICKLILWANKRLNDSHVEPTITDLVKKIKVDNRFPSSVDKLDSKAETIKTKQQEANLTSTPPRLSIALPNSKQVTKNQNDSVRSSVKPARILPLPLDSVSIPSDDPQKSSFVKTEIYSSKSINYTTKPSEKIPQNQNDTPAKVGSNLESNNPDELNSPGIGRDDVSKQQENYHPEDDLQGYDDDGDQEAQQSAPVAPVAPVAAEAARPENPSSVLIEGGYKSSGQFVDAEDSHFFSYFMITIVILICGYLVFHNKNKVLGLLVEGRRGESRRRHANSGPAYRKLDSTLEEAVNSAPPTHGPHIVY